MNIDVGPFNYRLLGLTSSIKYELSLLYPLSTNASDSLVDYELDIKPTSLIRNYIKKQCVIEIEGERPFNPIPPSKLLPSIEWAMNWAVAAYAHQYLILHCSVVVKDGKAILFPASSGSGKSTLSCYLGLNGWQLFSDEMALIDIKEGTVHPLFRPASLKNDSIKIIKEYLNPSAYLSYTTKETHKGDIAHVRCHERREFETFQPARVCAYSFIYFKEHAQLHTDSVNKVSAFSNALLNAFNYTVNGSQAFHMLSKTIEEANCFSLTYSDMCEVNEYLTQIALKDN